MFPVHRVIELVLGLSLLLQLVTGCGPTADPPPAPDASVTADPPHEPPPVACLPWPCPDGGAP